MTVNNIYIGDKTSPSFFFSNDQIIEVSANTSVDAIGNELKIDTLNFKVYYDDSDGQLRALTYATPIWYYNGTSFVGKFYFKSIERVGEKHYVIDAVSVIGLLEYEKHYGGMFINKNLKSAVESVLTTDGVSSGELTPCEYLKSNGSTPNTALLPGSVGANATVSGRTTTIRIKFQIDDAPSSSAQYPLPIWYLYSEGFDGATPSSANRYGIGVNLNSPNGIIVSCNNYSYSNSPYPDLSTGINIGEIIEITFKPSLGQFTIKEGDDPEETFSTTAGALSNSLVPIYSLVGGEYVNGVFTPYTTNSAVKYRIYSLEFLSADGTETYAKYLPFTDRAGEVAYIKDEISGKAIAATGFVPGDAQEKGPYTYYEYASTDGTGTNTEFYPGYKGESVDSSGDNTAIYLKFKINDNPSDWTTFFHVIWDNNFIIPINAQADEYKFFDVGVMVAKESSSPGTYSTYIYCSLRDVYNGPVLLLSNKNAGDVIEVAIYPKFGKVFTRTNGAVRYNAVFTPVQSYDLILPMYSLYGVTEIWKSDTHSIRTVPHGTSYTAPGYSIYRLCFFDHADTSTASVDVQPDDTIFFDIEAAVNSVGGQRFHDRVSGSYFATDYTAGGEVTGHDDDESIYEKIAKSIMWQDGVDQLSFSGWIPAGTKRDTLHQILFALNLNLYKSESGDLIIGSLPGIVSQSINMDEIYDEGSTENVKKPKQIEVTEYAYNTPTQSAEMVVVFDNSEITTPEGEYIAEFDNAPIYGTPVSNGLTILEYNANAARVTGKGTISAKIYTMSTRVIKEQISARPDGDTVSVTDAHLVTFLTSASVMAKLKAYYANNAYKIKNAIIGNGELVGRKYTLYSPFKELDDAYLVSANLAVSSIAKLNCEFLAGYIPPSSGAVYKNVSVLTGNGTWAVPDGTEKIRLVLIGGGNGGDSGYAGQDGSPGEQTFYSTATEPSEGGMYGNNGLGGKILEVEIESPTGSWNYSCGTGGSGGAICYSHETNNSGGVGSDTTFAKSGETYSSANGTRSENGYTDLLTGNIFASPMPQWDESSGKGGNSGYHVFVEISSPDDDGGTTWYSAQDAYNKMTGETFAKGDFNEGRVPFMYNSWTPIYYGDKSRAHPYGGDGGGAAIGQNGSDACGIWWRTRTENPDDCYGGDGGNATYVPPSPTDYNPNNYGSGGMGGCGGGGGGSGGTEYLNFDDYDRWADSTPGVGGYGGRGGNGGNGCILVYW